MSISGLSSTFSQQQLGAVSNPYQQQIQQLGQDLQSGNLSAAKSDFSTLQQAFSQTATSAGSPTNTSAPVNQAFNQLSADLQSGNLAAAQKDLSTVQQDIKGYGTPPASVFHPHGGPVKAIGSPATGGVSSKPSNPPSLNFSQLAPSLPSSTPAGAQQAYANLQQQFQQFALGSEDSEELSNLPVSLVA